MGRRSSPPFNIEQSTFNIQHAPFSEATVPIARSGVVWRRIFFLLLLAFTATFIWYRQHEYPHGGSRWGLFYGIVGFFLCYLLAFFGIRKRRSEERRVGKECRSRWSP